jgi:histone H2B
LGFGGLVQGTPLCEEIVIFGMPPKVSNGTTAAKAVKTVKAKPAGQAKKSKRRRRAVAGEYRTYIHKILKQVHPTMEISRRGMNVMNDLIREVIERIFIEASSMCSRSKKVTLSSREIQTAVRLILPGEIAKHAVSEGTKAVTKYTACLQK